MAIAVLARHGLTDWNVQRRLQGQTDVPLNAEGQEQAAKLALNIKRDSKIRIRRLVCSDLSRAYQTALVVGIVLDIPMTQIVRDDRLRECRFGRLEGLAIDDARRLAKEPADAPEQAYPYDYTPWGGEDYLMVLARHVSAIIDHTRGLGADARNSVLFVGHGRGLGTVLHHNKLPPKMVQGGYRLLEF